MRYNGVAALASSLVGLLYVLSRLGIHAASMEGGRADRCREDRDNSSTSFLGFRSKWQDIFSQRLRQTEFSSTVQRGLSTGWKDGDGMMENCSGLAFIPDYGTWLGLVEDAQRQKFVHLLYCLFHPAFMHSGPEERHSVCPKLKDAIDGLDYKESSGFVLGLPKEEVRRDLFESMNFIGCPGLFSEILRGDDINDIMYFYQRDPTEFLPRIYASLAEVMKGRALPKLFNELFGSSRLGRVPGGSEFQRAFLRAACINGSQDVLDAITQSNWVFPVVEDSNAAAMHGQVDMLTHLWLHYHIMPSVKLLPRVICSFHIGVLRWFLTNFNLDFAAKKSAADFAIKVLGGIEESNEYDENNALKLFDLLREFSMPLPSNLADVLCGRAPMSLFWKLLFEYNYVISMNCFTMAAIKNRTEIFEAVEGIYRYGRLTYGYLQNLVYPEAAIHWAAYHGNQDIRSLIERRRPPWSFLSPTIAIYYGKETTSEGTQFNSFLYHGRLEASWAVQSRSDLAAKWAAAKLRDIHFVPEKSILIGLSIGRHDALMEEYIETYQSRPEILSVVMNAAIKHGRVRVIQAIQRAKPTIDIDSDVLREAALEHSDIAVNEILGLLDAHDVLQVFEGWLLKNDLSTLDQLIEYYPALSPSQNAIDATYIAAAIIQAVEGKGEFNAHKAKIKWIVKHGWLPSTRATDEIAELGAEWIFSEFEFKVLPSSRGLDLACGGGHLSLLGQLVKAGRRSRPPKPASAAWIEEVTQDLEQLTISPTRPHEAKSPGGYEPTILGANLAAVNNHEHILDWLEEEFDISPDANGINAAFGTGQIQIALRYPHLVGEDGLLQAAEMGYLDAIRAYDQLVYLLEPDSLLKRLVEVATKHGHQNIVIYLHHTYPLQLQAIVGSEPVSLFPPIGHIGRRTLSVMSYWNKIWDRISDTLQLTTSIFEEYHEQMLGETGMKDIIDHFKDDSRLIFI